MRIFPVILAIIATLGIYFAFVDRDALRSMRGDSAAILEEVEPDAVAPEATDTDLIQVLVQRSTAREIDSAVILRGQTEAARSGLTAAEAGIRSAAASIESAAALVAAADKDLSRVKIYAPFAGLLESDTAELGSLMQPGSLCATVIQLDPIKLVAFVPETEVNRVKLGARAGAQLAAGGATVTGRVTFLSRAADETTRTFRVEIEVPNDSLTIRDGQTAEILIEADGALAHLLPSSALTLDDAGTLGLRTVDDGGVVAFNAVRILRDTQDGVWVTGLADTANVIVVGQEFVRAGVQTAPSFKETTQ